jgi:hypothetical protein
VNYRSLIERNAEECKRLQARIHETFTSREKNEHKRREWELACREFHAKYDSLAFPGGYSGAFERMAQGDQATIEAALAFIELRPYFFRSGYMYWQLIPKLKKAPLNFRQKERLESVLVALAEWRKAHPKPGRA